MSNLTVEQKRERAVDLCKAFISRVYLDNRFTWGVKKTEDSFIRFFRITPGKVWGKIRADEIRLRFIYWVKYAECTIEMEIDRSYDYPGNSRTTKLISEFPADLDQLIEELKDIYLAIGGFVLNED